MVKWYLIRVPKKLNKEGIVIKANGIEKLFIHMEKTEPLLLFHPLYI